MISNCTADAVKDLEQSGKLLRVHTLVDPHLELGMIQRRLYASKAPAVLFERVKGSPFPVLANLYGTEARVRHLFRHTWNTVEAIICAKGDPLSLLKQPALWPKLPGAGLSALPRKVCRSPVLRHRTSLAQLPQIVSWPDDGGAFITLPQVCTLDPRNPSILHSNLGMYRIQLGGNQYLADQECGLHYQLHRGIGVHHQAALELNKPLKVSIFVGGPPAHAFAAVMPLPEGMPELAFAGVLAGRAFRYEMQEGWVVSSDADFCILGEIAPDLKPEGPFGDHLGYYSLAHDFPYLKVHAVYHRPGAIWPFTTVGRPPQEDTTFGAMIHALTAAAVPASLPGIREVHAVDVAGVHPLCLAIGSERYVPFVPREPRELLTQANALLGFGQISLAKYLWIAAGEDAPHLSTHSIEEFFCHVLSRVDFSRDLHFQTRSTIDTLDYSGVGLNQGSKVVIAAAGEPRRSLAHDPSSLSHLNLPGDFADACMVMPGVLAVQAPEWVHADVAEEQMVRLCAGLAAWPEREQWPLVCVVDDAAFVARNLDNWLWVCFTRSNPSHDLFGVNANIEHKHWGCDAPLVIDARRKTHHANPLLEDPVVQRRVDTWFAPNGDLHGWG